MSNINKEQTEELIKEKAKDLFFVQGKFDANTQEIADEAGVNRTLINYYFRSRDNLIKTIFEEAQDFEYKKSKIIENQSLTLREKIETYVEKSLANSIKYPYLETYIVTQMNKGTCEKEREMGKEHLEQMYGELEIEMEKGNVEKMEPVQFVLNLISLLSFPIAMRPLLMKNLHLTDKTFDRIIAERKNIIMNVLFKN